MKNFMDNEFLLDTETARRLYHEYAENAPIIDYHCHINPREIYEDKRYENITQLWLGVGGSYAGDHYKWRLMRACGVDENEITGTAPDDVRFRRWAECVSLSIGNPLYHWSHLELKKYFGFEGFLTGKNAKEVYDLCAKKLEDPAMSVRGLIRQSNVKVICTTDDPADTLEWHRKLAEDASFETKVYPAWRPDKATNIEKNGFPEYIAKLGAAAGIEIRSYSDLKEALLKRLDFFGEMGCTVSDHGSDYVMYAPASDAEAGTIFAKRLAGDPLSNDEIRKYHTSLMLFLGAEYAKRGWVMQLHFGCKRDNNTAAYRKMGPDTGFDCIGKAAPLDELADFLNALELTDSLPKTIVYSLNPNDAVAIDTIIGCFQSKMRGKLQNGSAWWFNDHIDGMTAQLQAYANEGCLASFIGMLTDSRSFLSYTRHDYFRRILCGLLGRWVEEGMYPADYETLGKIVSDICYGNAAEYFGFRV